MLYSSLVTLGVMSVTVVLVTEEATSHDEDIHVQKASMYKAK